MGLLLKKLSNFFKFKKQASSLKMNPSAQTLATWNTLNRRKNLRVNYAHIGAVGFMPKIRFKEYDMTIKNISVGGVLIADDMDVMGFDVDTSVNLDLVWPDQTCTLRSKIVGAQLSRRHIQFDEFAPDAFVRITRLIQPGYLGAKFHQVIDNHKLMEAKEFWIGPGNENLQIINSLDQEINAKVLYEGRPILIPSNARPYWEDRGEPLSQYELSDLLVLISNFPNATKNIQSLIEHLQNHFLTKPKHGSHTNGAA